MKSTLFFLIVATVIASIAAVVYYDDVDSKYFDNKYFDSKYFDDDVSFEAYGDDSSEFFDDSVEEFRAGPKYLGRASRGRSGGARRGGRMSQIKKSPRGRTMKSKGRYLVDDGIPSYPIGYPAPYPYGGIGFLG